MDIIDHIIKQISEFGQDVARRCGRANGLYMEAHDVYFLYIDGRCYKCRCIEEAHEMLHMRRKMDGIHRDYDNYTDIRKHKESFYWNKSLLRKVHATQLMFLLMSLQKEEKKLCKNG